MPVKEELLEMPGRSALPAGQPGLHIKLKGAS